MARSSADNAAMESFFALLQKDVLEQQRWATRAELRLAIVTWIEKTYHRTRRQRRLGRLTPIEFEKLTGPHTRSEPLNPTSQQKWGQSGSTFEEALALPREEALPRGRGADVELLGQCPGCELPGGELAGDCELPDVRGRLVAEPRATTLAPSRLVRRRRIYRAHRSSPPRLTSCLAITPRWISLVPSPTIISGASRK